MQPNSATDYADSADFSLNIGLHICAPV